MEEKQEKQEKTVEVENKSLEEIEQKTFTDKSNCLFSSLFLSSSLLFLLIPWVRHSIYFVTKFVLNFLFDHPFLLRYSVHFSIFFKVFYKIDSLELRLLCSFLMAFILFYSLLLVPIIRGSEYYYAKFIFWLMNKASFVVVLAIVFLLSYLLSNKLSSMYINYVTEKKKEKIYTYEDAEFLEDFIKRNIPLFVLFSNNKEDENFYLGELKNISKEYKGQYHFALLQRKEPIERKIYTKVFKGKIVEFPKFALINGDNIDIIDEFDKKKLIEEIKKKVESFEIKEDFKNEKEMEEAKKKEEEIKRKEEEEIKRKEEEEIKRKKEEEIKQKLEKYINKLDEGEENNQKGDKKNIVEETVE